MDKSYAAQVSERFIAFGQRKFGSEFGWKSKFADALGMKPQALQSYFDGTRIPGFTVLARLQKLGCSSDWLLYGEMKEYKIKGENEELATLREEVLRLKHVDEENARLKRVLAPEIVQTVLSGVRYPRRKRKI
jgi:hypothetical protein